MTPEEVFSEAANMDAELWAQVAKVRELAVAALVCGVIATVVALFALGFAILAAP